MRTQSSRYRLASWDSLEDGERPVAAAFAQGWLHAWLTDPALRAEVADICDELDLPSLPSRGFMDERELHLFVRPAIERSLMTGRLVLLDRVKAGKLPQLEQPHDDPPPAPKPDDPKPTKTWIEFDVLDENGDPLADEKWEAVLPDGTKKNGKTDSKGVVRFEDIDPGLVEFRLPERDGDTWKSPKQIEETDFLEFDLVDESDTGVPIESWELKLADGKTRTGITDDDGHTRLESIVPGEVELTFTDLDGGSWKKL